jgi:hypothetical protein
MMAYSWRCLAGMIWIESLYMYEYGVGQSRRWKVCLSVFLYLYISPLFSLVVMSTCIGDISVHDPEGHDCHYLMYKFCMRYSLC